MARTSGPLSQRVGRAQRLWRSWRKRNRSTSSRPSATTRVPPSRKSISRPDCASRAERNAGHCRWLSSASARRSWHPGSCSAAAASMPVAARLAPAPAVARSNTATERPRNASRHAIDKPMTPAPTTAISTAPGIATAAASTLPSSACAGGKGRGAPDPLSIDPMRGDAASIKKTSTRFGWRFWPLVVGAISNPYAGTNRVRFKGFPRCRPASGFSAPCRGSPWNVRHLMPPAGQGQGAIGGDASTPGLARGGDASAGGVRIGRRVQMARADWPNCDNALVGPQCGRASVYLAPGRSLMRRARAGFCWLVLSLGASVPAHAQQTVKVGLIMTYSGQFADAAAQMDNGVKLYVKQHGDTVAGRKIEIIRRDTGGAPDAAKRLAQELIVRDNVDILAGFVITPEALAVADLSAEAKKFMVVMNAATSIITTRSPYLARVSLTLPQNCEQLGTWAFKNGVRKVYTMVSDYAPGHDAEVSFQSAFKAAGGEIIGAVRMPVTTVDFSPFVQRVKDQNPEAIFVFIPGGSQPPALAKALVERGIDPKKIKVMGQGEITEESALTAMGDAALGIVTAFHYDHDHESRTNADFVKAYNAEFKRNPDFFSVGGYDGMHLIYEALKKNAGKADGEGLIAAAKGMKWESPRGPMSIDPQTRDVIQTIYIRRVEKVNGQLRNVEIEKFENVKDPVKARMK